MAAAKKGRVDLAALGASVTSDSSTGRRPVNGQYRANVPLHDLAPNPRNPRDDLGTLADLASIAERQLQPATVITRARWLDLWPDDADAIGSARWVVVNGCRRLQASHQYGRSGLDVVVQDTLATSRDSIIWAAIAENLDRQNLDVLEEAKAVEQLISELGSADAAADRMGRSKTWVSHRRRLLDLHPDLQAELRAGELAIRDARELGRLPMASQVAAWEKKLAQRERRDSNSDQDAGTNTEGKAKAKDATPASAVRALRRLRAEPAVLASALIEVLDDDQLAAILIELRAASDRGASKEG